MDSSRILDELEAKSKQAQETINSLKAKIESLKKSTSSALANDQDSVERLKNENRLLKEQVEVLKNKLVQLDGVDQKPIVQTISVKQTNVSSQNQVVSDATAAKPDESKKQKAKSNNTRAYTRLHVRLRLSFFVLKTSQLLLHNQ
jgi:FtsZ-binding cell division protein ZapB